MEELKEEKGMCVAGEAFADFRFDRMDKAFLFKVIEGADIMYLTVSGLNPLFRQ